MWPTSITQRYLSWIKKTPLKPWRAQIVSNHRLKTIYFSMKEQLYSQTSFQKNNATTPLLYTNTVLHINSPNTNYNIGGVNPVSIYNFRAVSPWPIYFTQGSRGSPSYSSPMPPPPSPPRKQTPSPPVMMNNQEVAPEGTEALRNGLVNLHSAVTGVHEKVAV